MTNEFAGRIIGVKCVKVIGNIAYALIVKFKDEMLLSLLPKENKGEYIKEMISKYNLGVANTETFFIYDNHEDVIYARFNLYSKNYKIYEDILPCFDDSTQRDIVEIAEALKPNCDIENIGITFDKLVNNIKIVQGIPEDLENDIMSEHKNEDAVRMLDFNGESVLYLLRKNVVRFEEGYIFEIHNSWNNEYWSESQSNGGFKAIGEGFEGNYYEDYNFTLDTISNCMKFNHFYDKKCAVYYDENCIVSLTGNQETGFLFVFPLGKRDFFKPLLGVNEDSKIFGSGVFDDLYSVLSLDFISKDEYMDKYPYSTLKLQTIEKIEKYFEEYEDYKRRRFNRINKEMILYSKE